MDKDTKHILLEISGIKLSIEKNILLQLDYFDSLLNRWYDDERCIKIDEPTISISGFFYILDILKGKNIGYKPEYKNEIDFFGLDFGSGDESTVGSSDSDESEFEDSIDIKTCTENKINRSGLYDLVSVGRVDQEIQNLNSERNYKGELINYYNSTNPEIRFSEGFIENESNNFAHFNRKVSFDIKRHGDFFTNTNFEIKLKGLPDGIVWKRFLGFKILKSVKLLIGNSEIITIPSSFLEAEYHLYTSEDQKCHELVFDLDYEKRKQLSKEAITLIVPIHFIRPNKKCEYEKYKRAFSVISSSHYIMKVEVELENYSNLIENFNYSMRENVQSSIVDIKLLTEYQWLERDVRQYFAQIPLNVFLNTVHNLEFEFVGKNYNPNVNFRHVMKDFIIVVIDLEKNKYVNELDVLGVGVVNGDKNSLLSCTSQMLKYVYPIKYLKRKIPVGYYYYSFCIEPYNTFKNTQTFTTGRVDNLSFDFKMKYDKKYKIILLSSGINILRYYHGQCGSMFI